MILLTRQQLEEKLCLSRAGLKRLVRLGMPVLKITRRTFRYDWEKVEQWLNEQNEKYAGFDEPEDSESFDVAEGA